MRCSNGSASSLNCLSSQAIARSRRWDSTRSDANVWIAFHIVQMFNSVALTSSDKSVKVTDEGIHAMSKRSRYRQAPDQRRRRWSATGTGVGVAVGGAMAAAFVSMGTASADDLLGPAGGDDTVTSLAQAIDLNALTAAVDPSDPTVGGAAVPAQATLDGFEQLVLTIDPNAFTAAGDPNDFLGTLASQIDSDLASTVFGPELNTIATQITCADTPACEPSLLITAPATGDDGFTVLEQFVAQTYVPEIIPAVLVPSLDSDLASIASQLDGYFAGTVFGPEWFTIAEQIIGGL
jgi:hypothetical protein